MRFHLVSLPHTQTTLDYSACAFTEKAGHGLHLRDFWRHAARNGWHILKLDFNPFRAI
jgi:hypothetical protein